MLKRRLIPLPVLGLAGVVLAPCWARPGAASGAEGEVRCAVRPMDRIPSGTKLKHGPPEGWTHLVFKTRQKLSEGTIDDLPDFSKMLAEFLFTAIAARVVPDDPQAPKSFRLDKVAIGVGAAVKGEDVILTPQTQEQLGADLGPFKKIILSRAEEHLGKIQQVAAGDTLAVVDAATVILRNGRHENVVFRYMFLVHPPNGALASVVWPIDQQADGRYRSVCGPAVLVKPNLVSTCPLHVDGKEIIAGIPSSKAFATTRLPMGTSFELPAAVRGAACQQPLTAEAARLLERQLRDMIAFPEGR